MKNKSTSNGTKNKQNTTYISQNLQMVIAMPIDWVWNNVFATKVNVIAGPPGVGKSQLTLDMVATVTTGGKWADGTKCKKGSAILISSEDYLADTIKPRLQAAGAKLKKVEYFSEVVIDGKPEPWTLEHIDALEDAIRDQGDTRLIVIDPITAYMGNKSTDSHNNAVVRSLMIPLQELAASYNVCILLITHLNKTKGGPTGDRIMGSGAWLAVCRSSWMVGFHPKDENLRVIVPIKNNIGIDATGFSYTIEQCTTADKIKTSRIVWKGSSDVLASQVKSERDKPKDVSEINRENEKAAFFIETILQQGKALSEEVIDRVMQEGISESAFTRGRKILTEEGVISTKKIGRKWYMMLKQEIGKIERSKGQQNS